MFRSVSAAIALTLGMAAAPALAKTPIWEYENNTEENSYYLKCANGYSEDGRGIMSPGTADDICAAHDKAGGVFNNPRGTLGSPTAERAERANLPKVKVRPLRPRR